MPVNEEHTVHGIRSIVVAGDVSIDWLARDVPAVDAVHGDPRRLQNWQLRQGTRMVAMHGGALLLAQMVRAATSASGAAVASHVLSADVEKVPPTETIHSLVHVARYPGGMGEDDDLPPVWRISRFAGFAGPDDGTPIVLPVTGDDAAAGIVILDDAGNGFRDEPSAWPAALSGTGRPIVLYKMSRPLAHGPLWDHVCAAHAERLVVIVSAEDLRAEGARISRRLSWERTAKDAVWQLATNPGLLSLANCRHLIVRFDIDGALHHRMTAECASAALTYDPARMEGGFEHACAGEMSGYNAAFVAALARRIGSDGLEGVGLGIEEGICCSRRLLLLGFGTNEHALDYPGPALFGGTEPPVPPLARTAVGQPTTDEAAAPKYGSILQDKGRRRSEMEHMAYEVVLNGPERALRGVPTAAFGKLDVVDRSEIESYRAIRNLVQRYLAREKVARPLCIAVFGQPGSGKSFGVEQVALSLADDRGSRIEKLEFNVAQWRSPADLVRALHIARDKSLAGRVPLVFLDEFDAPLTEGPSDGKLGWLKYFLAPMQDGSFKDGDVVHPIGRAILVFCGGTAHTYDRFYVRPPHELPTPAATKRSPALREHDRFVAAKGPDFISRLRGYIDVKGPNPDHAGDNVVMVRRALILRRLIERVEGGLIDSYGVVRIDPGVLRALIRVPRYEHGVRSMEAILDMSLLAGRKRFEQAALPPSEQLCLHVDAERFVALLNADPLPPDAREIVARAIHETYVADQRANKRKDDSHPSMQPWDGLAAHLKFSNYHQADDIPRKLAAVGCGYERSDAPGPDPSPSPSSDGTFAFSPADLAVLAPMEHERFVVERRLAGWTLDRSLPDSDPDTKRSPHLVRWDELSEGVRAYDRMAMEALPGTMKRAGYEVYRLGRDAGMP